MYNAPPPYSPYPNGIPPAPPRKRGNGWLYGLGGCGLIVLLLVIVGAVAVNKIMKGGAVQQMQTAQQCGYNLFVVRDAFDRYRKAHNGSYPATLSELSPLYLADKDTLVCGSGKGTMALEYTPPKPNAPDNASVLAYHGSEADFMTIQTNKTGDSARITRLEEVRLLKNGRIVTDSITRTQIGAATSGRGASTPKATRDSSGSQ